MAWVASAVGEDGPNELRVDGGENIMEPNNEKRKALENSLVMTHALFVGLEKALRGSETLENRA
jgi:hypothetical protein